MIPRLPAILLLIATLIAPAAAQEGVERVSVVTQRQIANGALFIATVRGYFKAEGLELQLGAYNSAHEVVEAVAAGSADFGLTEFTPVAFNLAGQGAIRAVAAQAREKRDFEGAEVVAANGAYSNGLRKLENLGSRVVAIDALGSASHYQLSEIARVKGFNLSSMVVKPVYSVGDLVKAVKDGTVDAAILPAQSARDLATANQGKLVGWISEIGEPQTGALFASSAVIKSKRETVEKFVRAYRRGVADYASAMLRRDRYAKRVSDKASQDAAGIIARYVYPGNSLGTGLIDGVAPFIDPKARIDIADIERQLDWYKAQGFVEKTVEARDVVDLSFTAGN